MRKMRRHFKLHHHRKAGQATRIAGFLVTSEVSLVSSIIPYAHGFLWNQA